MSDKALINQPKMNFFQRIRKKITMRIINKKYYSNLPDYLKNDTEVINKMIEKDISAIEVLPDNLATEYIKKNPSIIATNFFRENGLIQHYIELDIELFDILPDNLATEYIKKNPSIMKTEYFEKKELVQYYVEIEPELFDGLHKNAKFRMIFIDEQYQYIKQLDEDFQTRILTGYPSILIPISQQKMNNITSKCGKIADKQPLPLNGVLITFKIDSGFFAENLNYFSENVIYNAVKNNLEIVKLFDFTKLAKDIQLNIAHMNNSLLIKMDKDVIQMFFENRKVTIQDISKLQINDTDKFQLIKMLEIKIDIETLIKSNISNELAQLLKDEISDIDLNNYLNEKIPQQLKMLGFDEAKDIYKIISIFGIEKIDNCLSKSQKDMCSIITELFNNFDEAHIEVLFDNRELEMNFIKNNPEYKEKYKERIINLIQEINNKDNGLSKLKGYCDFRRKNTGLDFAESLLKSIDEYKEYGDLYNSLLENYVMFTEEEKAEFKDRWTDLMNLNNKFKIKNIHDFKNFDEKEKEFYSGINYHTETSIKRDICEILVRNPNIYRIITLGNGTEYSMENKSLEDVVDILSTLNEMTDLEALKGILKDCIELIGSEELKHIRSIGRNIEEKIVQEYREGYTESFTNYEDMSDEELSKMKGVRVERIDNVRVIHLEGIDFSFLAHIGNVSGNHHRCCCSYITNENYATQSDGLVRAGSRPYIFSKLNPKRIKLINVSDAGYSEYPDDYISNNDLPMASLSTTGFHSFDAPFNEVTFSTKKEDGDNKQEVKTTTRMISSKYFDRNEYLNSKDETNPRTIYVLHEEIYREKNKQYELKKDELVKKYLQTLDPKFLNLLLQRGTEDGGYRQELNIIETCIKNYIDARFGKGILRRNLSRYAQLLRKRNSAGKENLDYITTKLRNKLEQMDNEFLTENSFRDKIKEVANNYGDER